MKQRLEQMESYSGGTGKYTKKDAKHDVKTRLHGLIQIFCSTIIYGKWTPLCAHMLTTFVIQSMD
jgi:hypothetical protein